MNRRPFWIRTTAGWEKARRPDPVRPFAGSKVGTTSSFPICPACGERIILAGHAETCPKRKPT